MATSKQSYRELRTKLDELMTWFEGEDLDVDEALKKHAEAEKVIKDLEEYLVQTEQKIKKISTL
jgi:exodeoxyribonuclease VII small subunit